MEEILEQLIDKKIDVSCGSTAVFRGRLQSVTGGVLCIVDEDDRNIYIAVDKITAVCECRENSGRPGFVA
jgi:hypothetical protein